MSATERDGDYERWQSALIALQEVSGQYREVGNQYQQLLRSVQSGFNTLSMENAAIHRRLTQIEGELVQLRSEFHTMGATLHKLLPHMAAIAAYIVAQEQREQQQQPAPQPQPRPRTTRRPNGG